MKNLAYATAICLGVPAFAGDILVLTLDPEGKEANWVFSEGGNGLVLERKTFEGIGAGLTVQGLKSSGGLIRSEAEMTRWFTLIPPPPSGMSFQAPAVKSSELKRNNASLERPLEQPDPPDPLPTGTTIRLPEFFFDSGSHTLKPQGKEALRVVAQAMNDAPDVSLHVEGHTDNVGSDIDNLKLGMDRANEVVSALVTMGISRDRFTIQSYGEERPEDSNEIPDGRAANRRVDLIVRRLN